MTLDRQAFWNGLWPWAAIMLLLPSGCRWWAFAALICFDTGHVVSSIIAAWLNPGFRRIMAKDKERFIAAPVFALTVTCAIGWATQAGLTTYLLRPHQMWRVTDLSNPFPLLVWGYWLFDIYHFGMQNFGVARLCSVGGVRKWQLIVALSVTAGAICFGPRILSGPGVLALVAISVNHWLVSLSLNARVSRHPLVLWSASLAIGAAAFLWTVPTAHGNMIRVLPILLCLRMGAGIAHFLYDSRLYRLSDPAVRATIGKDLFANA